MSETLLRINLGCSDDLLPGYLNVDIAAPAGATDANFMQVDLAGQLFYEVEEGKRVALFDPERWPWDDSSVDEIKAHDVFEHIHNQKFPGQLGIIWAMNEAHRVLKPGGLLDLVVPCLPGETPFVDPTHVQVWTQSTRYYFDQLWAHAGGERGRLGPAYGITAVFKTIGGRSFQPTTEGDPQWIPIAYASDDRSRRKLMLHLECVKEGI